ncbi:hypothetical protein [Clostridium tepidiprofundi]|uniref:hypothetical protein n=1 Tax=Clostridium tepidiprofundi TaxID=420412 RepID=UPI00128EF9BD|nr:hypothetical protein [Clostridium tepidiprofundi]
MLYKNDEETREEASIEEKISIKSLIEFIFHTLFKSLGIPITIKSLLKIALGYDLIDSHMFTKVIILSIIIGIVYVGIILICPPIGYNTTIRKVEVLRGINDNDRAIKTINRILERKKLSCDHEADLRYILAYMYVVRDNLVLAENEVYKVLNLPLDRKSRINMFLKIGTYIYGAIDIDKAISYLNDALNSGYDVLKKTDFFSKKDKLREINVIMLIDKYLYVYGEEKAKEIFEKLVENRCCKNYKSVREMFEDTPGVQNMV